MKTPASDQKLRGGYYTPSAVASFLASWAVRTADDRVLEPSCGDGEIVESLVHALRARKAPPTRIGRQLRAIEFDADEAEKARVRLTRLGVSASHGSVQTGDFFTFCRDTKDARYDAVVGNPPFIRYQNFPSTQREVAFELMRAMGMRPNGLTNAWVPFVCLAATRLSDTGRLAMVIPSELLQVSYSAELRRFLSDSFQSITLYTFKRLLFKEAQQEVVLLCGERNGRASTGIEVVELHDADDLARQAPGVGTTARKPMDHSTEKWTQYFLSHREIDLLRAMRTNPALTRLGDVASVDVGVVTGLNEFFVLTETERTKRRLTTYTVPVVTRSAQLQGLAFGAKNLRAHDVSDVRAHMLNLPPCTFERLPIAAQSYVREGEARGCNLGFKCRTRKPWWVVPGPWVPDAFMLRQVHRHPKLTVNHTEATCTDTVHRVRLLNGVKAKSLSSAFINSLTFAFSEVLGRSYGGGVLELEPTEAEKLPVPLAGAEALDFAALHRLVEEDRLDEALDETDRVLLRGVLGLSATDARNLRGIWLKLSERRRTRRAPSARAGVKDTERIAAIG